LTRDPRLRHHPGMDRRRPFLLTSLAGALVAPLIGVLAVAAAEPLWTLWRIEEGGTPSKFKAGLDQQTCETYRENAEEFASR
jgi:hypothetical protein